jgi:DNA-binding GntR family transcriptional regulator
MARLVQSAPPERSELWEEALVILRNAVISGELAPGTRLVEAELSADLHVSRWPVRQAITRLAQEGLVVRSPNRGAFVVEFTAADVREIHALRCLIEGHAAAQAAERLTAEDAERLRDLIAEMRRYQAMDDAAQVNRLDVEFHRMVVTIAGSQRLLAMWEVLLAPMHALLNLRARIEGHGFITFSADHHQRALDALVAGDAATAARILSHHPAELELGALKLAQK